jgi:hypothetical protein
MKKTALALTLAIYAILSLLAIEHQPEILVKGNPIAYSRVWITYPEAGNNTYYTNTLTVNYSADFHYVGHRLLVYSLDGGENITLYEYYDKTEGDSLGYTNGSVTLTGLSDGKHNIEIYSVGAWRLDGGGAYRDFWIDTSPRPKASPEPAPMAETLILVSSAAVALVLIGLFVYFKKRK